MKSRILSIWPLFLLIVACVGPAFSQATPAPKSVKEIRDAIEKSKSDDLKVSDKARAELSSLKADSIPNLVVILKKEKPCNAVVAANVIAELDPNNHELVPAVVKIVRGGNLLSLFHLQEEFLCRRFAAYVLPTSAEGLRSILELLKKGDTWEKQTAIFALDDFTEVGAYNDRPGEIEVMKEIIPVLAKLQSSKDETINEMSTEVLTQITDHPPKELADLAEKLVQK